MVLIPCPDCGRQISPSAAMCINCGRPMSATITPAASNPNQAASGNMVWKRVALSMVPLWLLSAPLARAFGYRSLGRGVAALSLYIVLSATVAHFCCRSSKTPNLANAKALTTIGFVLWILAGDLVRSVGGPTIGNVAVFFGLIIFILGAIEYYRTRNDAGLKSAGISARSTSLSEGE